MVTGGASIGRAIALDVGRVHYDLTRWTGTSGASATEGYAAIPPDGEVRAGDRMAVIGAAGPMGLMHVVRAASAGWKDLSITAVDIDDSRLAHLERAASRIAASHGVELEVANSRTAEIAPGFSYIALMVPAPVLVGQAVALAGSGCRINIFAGFATGTRAEIDLDTLAAFRDAPGGRYAHPTTEHFVPLFVTLGAGGGAARTAGPATPTAAAPAAPPDWRRRTPCPWPGPGTRGGSGRPPGPCPE